MRDAIADHVRPIQPAHPAAVARQPLAAPAGWVRFLNAPGGLPLIARQLLHNACFGAASVWLLADCPWQAVPAFVIVSLLLAGHWAVASSGDELVDWRRGTPM